MDLNMMSHTLFLQLLVDQTPSPYSCLQQAKGVRSTFEKLFEYRDVRFLLIASKASLLNVDIIKEIMHNNRAALARLTSLAMICFSVIEQCPVGLDVILHFICFSFI